ncbi:ceramide glucosyltransferase [Histoplasma capsulatum G186AR]|uniref:Ceramide glucosyltransferase n=2 Tax=Ajellomyces capsulatus TaxID=5037 RepID=C0NTT7_AJECG|nr:ceramide glucosyltransferase [Histoplasma capsulatum G186AR]EEH05448.1 ceramide glucosyltransferase [Histoplasma capsulatum G186AR]KAG5305181.1 ceramide glucosyltransferase [Histoplasma capsulatum]QSS76141.1 ceramide glucosyltransferase [Histoplasma capsulatum G186AR]
MRAERAAADFSNSNSPVGLRNGLPLQQGQYPPWLIAASWAAVIWYLIVTFVILVGWTRLQINYSSAPKKSFSASLRPFQVRHVTIIRPVKDLEPHLYECLAASFRQNYPKDKLTIYLCIATKTDPAFAVLKKLLEDFPDADARIFVEEESGESDNLGPNPKIRNMSRAYNEAKGDIVWIADCNVWMGKGVCGRMVDKLCGIVADDGTVDKQYRFVHQMPIAVDLGNEEPPMRNADERPDERQDFPYQNYYNGINPLKASTGAKTRGQSPSILDIAGGRLEELFLSSSHPKFYSAINTIVIAPCAVGKSTMFRRSHLDYLTSPAVSKPQAQPRRPGIDYFSDNICEDHLIGDCLFKGKPPVKVGERWGRHKLVYGDVAIQPVARMSVKSYLRRRIRWLRVRKYTVLLATLAEPGTESFLCSTYLAFGLSNLLAHYFPQYTTYLNSWSAFFSFWSFSIAFWIVIDWLLYLTLHSAAALEVDEHTPSFALPHPSFSRGKGFGPRRPFHEWFLAWVGREALALPIWLCAFYGGSTVVWRDHTFRVGMDLIATKIPGEISHNGDETVRLRSSSQSRDGERTGYGALNDHGKGRMDVRQRSPKTRGVELRN